MKKDLENLDPAGIDKVRYWRDTVKVRPDAR